jgi:hypothetical protein
MIESIFDHRIKQKLVNVQLTAKIYPIEQRTIVFVPGFAAFDSMKTMFDPKYFELQTLGMQSFWWHISSTGQWVSKLQPLTHRTFKIKKGLSKKDKSFVLMAIKAEEVKNCLSIVLTYWNSCTMHHVLC